MIIPSYVELLGVTVPVILGPAKKKKHKNLLGMAYHADKKICVFTTCRKKELSHSVLEHTFFHELLHQILDSANYKDINDDEQFVDVVSGLLHQALKPHMK